MVIDFHSKGAGSNPVRHPERFSSYPLGSSSHGYAKLVAPLAPRVRLAATHARSPRLAALGGGPARRLEPLLFALGERFRGGSSIGRARSTVFHPLARAPGRRTDGYQLEITRLQVRALPTTPPGFAPLTCSKGAFDAPGGPRAALRTIVFARGVSSVGRARDLRPCPICPRTRAEERRLPRSRGFEPRTPRLAAVV